MRRLNSGGSLATVAFVLIIFVSLTSFLSSFFVVSDGSIELDPDVDGYYDVPGSDPTFVSKDNEMVTDEMENVTSSGDETGYLIGGLMVVGGVVGMVLTGWSGVGAVASGALIAGGLGTVTWSLPGGEEVLRSVPVVGDALGMTADSVNYFLTAVRSFGELMLYDGGLLSTYPWLATLILVPIAFTFFYLIVSMARGVSA